VKGQIRRRLLLSRQRTVYQALAALSPALWYHFDEPSGTVAVNSGSLGATYNGVYTAATLAQAGALGPSNAVSFDGADTKVAVPAGPFGNYTAFTIGQLVKVSGSGEGGIGSFYDWNTSTTLRFNSSLSLRALRAATGAAASNMSNVIATNVWQWLFVTYDNTGDRKIYIYLYRLGVLSTLALSTQTAATGTMTDQTAQVLTLGNRSAQTATIAGLMDEWFMVPSALSSAQMAAIGRASNV
jgi:hypothetical protein